MKKNRRKATPAQRAAAQAKRAKLIAISRPIQLARKNGMLPWAEFETVNECIEMIYSQETGQSDWGTFRSWKDRGYSVKKGEHGRPIWGQPRKIKKPGQDAPAADAPAPDATTDEAKKMSFFPLAYIFHAGQVANEAGQAPASADQPAEPAEVEDLILA